MEYVAISTAVSVFRRSLRRHDGGKGCGARCGARARMSYGYVMICETRSRPYLMARTRSHGHAIHAEVDVEVGHGDAFRIQEALKQQVVIDRI